VTFNIGSQHAANINNVAGDQTIHDGQTGYSDIRVLLDQVRQEVAALRLPPPLMAQVNAECQAINAELTKSRPNRQAAAGRLDRLVSLLKSAGALATGGSGLMASSTALVNSFGALGEPIGRVARYLRVQGLVAWTTSCLSSGTPGRRVPPWGSRSPGRSG
jgi:hypothetical protein